MKNSPLFVEKSIKKLMFSSKKGTLPFFLSFERKLQFTKTA